MYRTLSFILLLSACTPEIANRGFDFEIANVDQVKIGQTKEEVQSVLGTPSTMATFKDNSWYYVSKKISQTSFFEPKTEDQKIVIVHFDNERVSKIETLNKDDAKSVKLSEKKTETSGYETGIGREIFGNFGRFSTKAPKKM